MTQASPEAVRPRASFGRGIRVWILSLTLAATAAFAFAAPVAAWDANSFSPDDEALLFSLTNQARAAAGLNALANDSYLAGLARWRSKDMIVRDYFSHNIPPSGELVFAQMQRDGYCFTVAGENIGISSYPDDVATTRIQTAFMNSPDHRANILGTWRNMGVGAYKGADGKKVWTVLFSQPCSKAIAPTPKPVVTPPPAPKVTPKPIVTPKPTVKVVVTPKPTVRPTPTPTASPTPEPTAAPTPEPTEPPAPEPTATLEPTAAPQQPEAQPVAQSLRVKPAVRSESWFDGLFRTLFGGLFG